ncbi:MAG: helicase C-terminal domain-containing protein [candidate division KSB1 bacterium]|nr:helicase C-terminal domain-containing protein [candidate division KSB1 bacterium]
MDITTYIAESAREQLARDIKAADGNEVFFVGYTDDNLVVQDVQTVARGHDTAVPVVTKAAREADVVIHNHPSGALKPSNADLSIATQLDDFSTAFYIVDNLVEHVYVVIEPFAKTDITPLDIDAIQALLGPDSQIAATLPGFEQREQQMSMILQVVQAFNNRKVASIEAGTGTGKTLAYLLPAVQWSLQNRERVVISTNTINLQEQLISKDIPFLQNVLDVKFKAALVKGRSNYVCLRKLNEVESELKLQGDEEDQDELSALIEWARNSKDGSKADLSFIPKYRVWERIASESDTCTRQRCAHFRTCFVNKARREAAQAQILVVNHHLLFADLAVRQETGSMTSAAVLPPYQKIIFDEAHHIENVATSYFGSQITRAGLIRMLHRLFRQKKQREYGYLNTLRIKLLKNTGQLDQHKSEKIENLLQNDILPAVRELLEHTNTVMDLFYEAVERYQGKSVDQEIKLRLLPDVTSRLIDDVGLRQPLEIYLDNLKSFTDDLGLLVKTAQQAGAMLQDPTWDSVCIDIAAQAERLILAGQVIRNVLFKHDEDHIRWIEAKGGARHFNILRFKISPLEIKERMLNAVYENFETVIMTSATLTVDRKFDFLASRIGLDLLSPARRIELLLDAPFDYQKQVVVAIPKDMPDPRHSSFAGELNKAVFKALNISNGRAFVLFTSYGLLNMLYRQMYESLKQIRIRLLKQGDENRHHLINKFKKDTHSVLFATDSFWEGVDVEGESLMSVIITKLPFRVPSEPVIEARYEAIEKRGGNAFIEYAVPLAVLKFKQGFGRLIRRKSDRGAVIIFDHRVISKSYGKRFLHSLPSCRVLTGTRETVFSELKLFFDQD